MRCNELIIYHNPGCSKSRETLQILLDNSMDPKIVEYLREPPNRQELEAIIEMLDVSARDLLRTTEQIYQDASLDNEALTDAEIVAVICQNPILLQRPIVVSGNRAVIGRPPENVLKLIA